MKIFHDRAADAERRLELLRNSLTTQLAQIPASKAHPSLCIYATGSLARKEANEHSDLDAFFLLSGDEEQKPLGRIRDVKILNAVLNAQEEAGFPDFSNDGAYLKFLYIDEVVKCIGHRDDDYKNAFTARILLLTESTPLYGDSNFERFRGKIIDVYFHDFHDHSKDFKPIFLINDLLRFWRTLCLNYENSRHWRDGNDPVRHAKGHLDNLKLKFSRLNICYSFITHLLAQGAALTRENVKATAELTPLERLSQVEQLDSSLGSKISEMRDHYAWFLGKTGRAKEETLQWISDEPERVEAFKHASRFVELTGDVVMTIAEKNGYLRYLVV